MRTETTDLQTLWKLIKDMKFGMFTRRHVDGGLHSCPLTTQNTSLDEDSQLYFFISRQSGTAKDVQHNSHVNVSYADPGKDSYVSVSGEATIVEDQAKKEALWSPVVKAWFPQGVTDPDLALLEVRIRHAEYWDVKESKMRQLIKMAQGAITGEPPQLGEHKELHMS